MAILTSTYSGLLSEALTIGAIIGALAGIIVYTASSASEGVQRVLLGILVGGVLMGVYQAIIISQAAGVTGGSGLNPLLQSRMGPFGGLVYRGAILTLQAALLGGLLMVVSLAPLRALQGAVAGVIIGSVAAFLSWGALSFVDTRVPLVIFYVLILGLVLFIIENIPRQG